MRALSFAVDEVLQGLARPERRDGRGLDGAGLSAAGIAPLARRALPSLEGAEAGDGDLGASPQLGGDETARRKDELGDLGGPGLGDTEPLGHGSDQLLLVHSGSWMRREGHEYRRAEEPAA